MQAGTPFWLTLTNIVLGVLVVVAVLYVASGPLWDLVTKLRNRKAYEAELNHDMREMFGAPGEGVDSERIGGSLRERWRRFTRRP